MTLSKAAILAADDLPVGQVVCPEWPDPATGAPGVVRLRSWTAADRDAFALSLGDDKQGLGSLRARAIALSAIDDEGNLLFSEADVEAIGKKNALVVARIFAEIERLNAPSDKDVEQLAKNFGSAPSGGTPSASPSASAG